MKFLRKNVNPGAMFKNMQGGREISAIILTDDYLCYKDQKVLTTFLF